MQDLNIYRSFGITTWSKKYFIASNPGQVGHLAAAVLHFLSLSLERRQAVNSRDLSQELGKFRTNSFFPVASSIIFSFGSLCLWQCALCVGPSVSRWQDYLSIFGHLRQ